MEWTVYEQMLFFAYSVCLGAMIGIVLNIFSGFGRNRSRVYRFWLDVSFGFLAAIMLFLGSLVIMDGQLHPLLLTGVGIGLLLEHLTMGRYLSKATAIFCKYTRQVMSWIARIINGFSTRLFKTAVKLPQLCYKMRKKVKKEGN